jgi:hypothetical protein
LNADIVVYCEGKATGIVDDDNRSEATYRNTADVYYWSKVVSSLGLTKRYHFKSLGSKSSLRKTAEDAVANDITTITVCVDADYEPLLGLEFHTARTCRTYGYSWENDVLSDEVFLELIEDVIGIGPLQTNAINEVRTALVKLRPVLAKWTVIDLSLIKRGKGCLFDREKPAASLNFQRHPELRETALSQRLIELGYSRGPRKVASVSVTDVSRRCFGKLWSKNLYHYGMQIFTRFQVQKLSYDLFMRQAIAATFRRVATIGGGEFLKFHRAQAAALS